MYELQLIHTFQEVMYISEIPTKRATGPNRTNRAFMAWQRYKIEVLSDPEE
jgi:hypothetical protein